VNPRALQEFTDELLGAAVYFWHPYNSWKRGLNRSTHGFLRQYFP
jgi:IS30 family transposase